MATGPEARGFVLYVGMDESAASAAGTSLTRLAIQLRRYVESVVPGSQAAAAVAIAPAGAPGTDLEVVRQALGGPSPLSGVHLDPVSTGRPGLVIDLGRREVRLDGEPLNLRNKEFELLEYLVEHGDRTMPRPELIHALWANPEEVPHERMIDSHVRRLRAKLGRLAGTVCTVRGQGYRFCEHPDVVVWPTLEYSI
jgi:DNA-binding response OmpR family regulator